MASNLTYQHKFVEGTEETTLLLLHGTGGDEDSMLGARFDTARTGEGRELVAPELRKLT